MTYRKLAKLAGVSPSTVYKVFSGSSEISRETAERIRQIAKEYGFTPIRYYKGGKNDLVKTRVAILVPEIISVYYSQIVTSMAQILGEYGIRPNIYLTGFIPKECGTIIQMLADEGLTDGILSLSASEINEAPIIPIVQLFSEYESKYLDSVGNDIQDGFMEAMEYLKSLGHQSVGFIGEKNTTRKLQYFQESAAALGLTADPSHIFISDKRFEKIGFEGADYFLKQDNLPTAILTAYDEVALGAMQVFTQSGVRIPEDISIIGINDIPFSSYTSIPLTTIQTYKEDIYRIAIQILLDKIRNPEKHVIQHIEVQCGLVKRNTTGPAKNS